MLFVNGEGKIDNYNKNWKKLIKLNTQISYK